MSEQEYWVNRGTRYENWLRNTFSKDYGRQEEVIRGLLKDLEFDSVLELGCGYGRITDVILEREPSKYVAVDISPEQIESASARLPNVNFVLSDIQKFETTERFDLVLAIEVLMHIPPTEIGPVVKSMLRWSSKYIMNLDFDEIGTSYPHNWGHDYLGMYAGHRIETRKVNNKQSLFLVTKET